MNKVVDFTQAKLDRTPHIAGIAFCMNCKHTWTHNIALSAMSEAGFECPSCLTMQGVFRSPPVRGSLVRECERCKNDVFRIAPTANDGILIYCAHCGELLE